MDDSLASSFWVTGQPKNATVTWLNKSPKQLPFKQLGTSNRYLSGLHPTHSQKLSSPPDDSILEHVHLSAFQPMWGSSNLASTTLTLPKLHFKNPPGLPPVLPLFLILLLFFFFFQIPNFSLPLFQTIPNRCASNQSKILLIVEKCTKVNPHMYNFMKGKLHLVRAFCKGNYVWKQL